MQWQVTDLSTWCLIVIYIGYQSVVDSPQWDVESISKFDYEEANTPMGPNGTHSELVFPNGTVYEGWMGFQCIKGILVIT